MHVTDPETLTMSPTILAKHVAALLRQRASLVDDIRRAARRPDRQWLADRVDELAFLNRELARLSAFPTTTP